MATNEPDLLIAAAVAAGQTYADAARTAGVSETTVYRRMKDPAFRAQVRQVQSVIFERATNLLAGAMADAAARLSLTINDDAASEAGRLRASEAVLKYAREYRSDLHTDDRLRAIEEKLGLTETPPDEPPNPNQPA